MLTLYTKVIKLQNKFYVVHKMSSIKKSKRKLQLFKIWVIHVAKHLTKEVSNGAWKSYEFTRLLLKLSRN